MSAVLHRLGRPPVRALVIKQVPRGQWCLEWFGAKPEGKVASMAMGPCAMPYASAESLAMRVHRASGIPLVYKLDGQPYRPLNLTGAQQRPAQVYGREAR